VKRAKARVWDAKLKLKRSADAVVSPAAAYYCVKRPTA